MSSVRIIAAGAALFIAATFVPTSARACDNIFFPCQPPGYQPPAVKPRPPATWGMQPAPTYRVAAPTNRVAAKPATRRIKKQRVRTVAAIAKPARAAAVAKPVKVAAITKAVAAVAEPAVETPAPAIKPAVDAPVPAARSIAVSVPPKPVDQPAQSGTREVGKETDPPAKLVAVVEVNEIDLAAGPVETFVPMIATAVVEESRDREDTSSAITSIAIVLAMFGGALAAGILARVVWAGDLRVIAGLDTASRVSPTCGAQLNAEIGQARVPMQSILSPTASASLPAFRHARAPWRVSS